MKLENLTPFKWYVLQNFPFIEEDFDAITNWQLFCKLGNEINKVINNVNVLGNQVEVLTNWFDNLDVQEEINNKLDEMAQDGTLAEIINQEIFGQLNTEIQAVSDEITEMKRRKFLIIGDSYLAGWTPDGTYTNWGQFFENITGFECDIVSQGGVGFANGSLLYYNLINNVTDTDYTDVIIAGGYNDRNASFTNIVLGVANCCTLIKSKFPSLKNIYIGMIGSSLLDTEANKLFSTLLAYAHGSKVNNCHYLNGIEYSLPRSDYFSSDGIHPNQNGLYNIALNLVNCINTGYANSFVGGYTPISINLKEDYTGEFTNFGGYYNNNVLEISKQGFTNLSCDGIELKANMRDTLEIGNISSALILTGNYANSIINVPIVIKNGALYYDCQGQLLIENTKLYLRILKINDTNSDFITFDDIEQIQIAPFHETFISNTI